MNIYEKLLKKETKLAVIGLGYVGLPIALEFARKISVVGFDINQQRVDLMKQGIDPSCELEKEAFLGTDILFTANIDDLKGKRKTKLTKFKDILKIDLILMKSS